VVEFSAKKNFQETADAKLHHELVLSTPFQRAGSAALLAYQDILTQRGAVTAQMPDASAMFHKLAGAREFWGVLLNLTEKPISLKPKLSDNLDHHA